MNYSLKECLRCLINGDDRKYAEWPTDVKLVPLSYNSHITKANGLAPYKMVFNLKPRKPIMFTANSSENAESYCQSNKNSICYDVTLHTHHEDHFHHPQVLELASAPHTDWIFNPDKKYLHMYQKIAKKLLQRQNFQFQTNSRLTPVSNLKIGTIVL